MKKLLVILSIALFAAASMAAAANGEAKYKASCAGCHGADGAQSAGGTTPLKDLDAGEIQKRLKGYADGSFGGAQKAVMENVAKKLSPEEISALADYAGGL